MCVCLSIHIQHMCTCVCICRERERDRDRDLKELSLRIVEVVKSKIYRVKPEVWRLEGRAKVATQVQRPSSGRIPTCPGEISLVLSGTSAEIGVETIASIMKGNLLYSKYNNVKVNLTQKHLHRNIQNNA